MESRNILLVVICVCAFLVIVFGVALWFTLPNGAARTNGTKATLDPYLIGDAEPTPTSEPDALDREGTVTLGIGQNNDLTPEPFDTPQPTIHDEKKTTPGKEDEEIVLLKIPLVEKQEQYEKHPVEKKKSEYREKKSKPTAQPKKQKIQAIEYWIQAGSYKSKSMAEIQAGRLTEHGFSGQIITREQGGALYYRVRIGPYARKAEADKFLAWIKVLDGLEESYISQIKAQKSVN